MSSFQETRSGTRPFPDRTPSSRQNRASGSRSSTDQEVANLSVGTLISDRYQVVKRLGLGGMGAVYRVEDLQGKKDRALKVMMPSLLLDVASSARFQREAELMRSLGGNGIVRVFEIGEDTQLGLKYYSMELLDGLSLRDVLTECQDRKRNLDQAVALEMTRQTLIALLPAHEQQIIHRDLKPENLFLKNTELTDLFEMEPEDIELIVLDFGIAKANDQLHLTQTQASFGTAAYMAPEQQLSARKVDSRADQYSIGVILHELLCHRIPLGGIASENEIAGPKAPELRRFLVKTLQEEPEQRFPDTESTLEALEALSGPTTKHNSLLLAVAILACAFATVIVLQFLEGSPHRENRTSKEPLTPRKAAPTPQVDPSPKIRPGTLLWEKISTVDLTTKKEVTYSHLSIDQLSARVYLSGQFARGYVAILETKNPKRARLKKRSLGSAVIVIEDADRYYVSSGYRGELITYAIDTNREIARLKIGFCGGYQALDKKKRLLYMASQCGDGNDPVHVFKADTGELATEKALRSGQVCVSVHVNGKTGMVYIGREDLKTLVLDSNAKYKPVTIFKGLVSAIDELNNRIIVNNGPLDTRFLRADTHKLIAQAFRPFGSIAIAASRDRAYCGHKNKVKILGLNSLKAITEFDLPDDQQVELVGCDEKRRLIFLIVKHPGNKKTLEIIKDRS